MRIVHVVHLVIILAALLVAREKFLLARRSSEALASEMKRLRQEARIEYLAGQR